jgi:hypothetical protein
MQKVGVCHKLHVEYVEIKSAQNNGSVEWVCDNGRVADLNKFYNKQMTCLLQGADVHESNIW